MSKADAGIRSILEMTGRAPGISEESSSACEENGCLPPNGVIRECAQNPGCRGAGAPLPPDRGNSSNEKQNTPSRRRQLVPGGQGRHSKEEEEER